MASAVTGTIPLRKVVPDNSKLDSNIVMLPRIAPSNAELKIVYRKQRTSLLKDWQSFYNILGKGILDQIS